MNWDLVFMIAGAVCLVIGTLFLFIAALGVQRFPDLLSRLHAAAKPQVVGLIFMMTGVALETRTPAVAWTCALVVMFQIITAPISAHMAGRAGYRTGYVDSGTLYVDEYRRDLVASLREQRDQQG